MKIILRFTFSFFLIIFISNSTIAQVNVVKFPELDSYITAKGSGEIKVINFWATWCGPCIKELPYFDALNDTYSKDELEVLLVSLDFADQVERVGKLLDKKQISTDVWLLDEADANTYIDRIDTRWSGAIPMTLLIKPSTGERIFLEKELTKEEIEQHINSLLE